MDSCPLFNTPKLYSNFRIKELEMGNNLKSLKVFYGVDTAGTRVIIFDSDFDGDLSKETHYLFPPALNFTKQAEEALLAAMKPVAIRYPQLPSIYLKPSLFNCCVKYLNKIDSIWHLVLEVAYYRKGKFNVDKTMYEVRVSGSPTPEFRSEIEDVYLFDSKAATAMNDSDPPYKINDDVIVNSHQFLLDSLSKYGDTIWIKDSIIGNSALGSRVGLFAPNIKTTDLNKNPFNLAEFRGKYVLLDFWGTWCGPCIDLMPHLRAINTRYAKSGLQLVSIAYDKKADFDKLITLTADLEMSWINIFSDMDAVGGIPSLYNVTCYPSSILLDPAGKIVFRDCGELGTKNLEAYLAEIFRE
jgi:thiol-disulfide isomerase/thioredoxin